MNFSPIILVIRILQLKKILVLSSQVPETLLSVSASSFRVFSKKLSNNENPVFMFIFSGNFSID